MNTDQLNVKKPKSKIRENLESIAWAALIALFIRSFFIEAYAIPTGSMISTLMIRDHLIVSKIHMGPKFPLTLTKALPEFRKPKRGDIIVFQYPNYKDPGFFISFISYVTFGLLNLDKDEFGNEKPKNWVKRLIGLPGETIEIKNRNIFIDGIPVKREYLGREFLLSENGGFQSAEADHVRVTEKELREIASNKIVKNIKVDSKTLSINESTAIWILDTKVENSSRMEKRPLQVDGTYIFDVYKFRETFEKNGEKESWVIEQMYQESMKDRIDNIPSMKIPKNGDLTFVDTGYEESAIPISKDTPITSSMVQKTWEDSYFMMGDNRDNSKDGRIWGVVESKYLIGQALFNYWPPKRIGLLK